MREGEFVLVKNPGALYRTYDDMAKIMKLEHWEENQYLPDYHKEIPAQIVAMELHEGYPDGGLYQDVCVGIEYPNGDQFIVGLRGLVKLDGAFFTLPLFIASTFTFDINHSGEYGAGIRPYTETVFVTVASGDPGGAKEGEDSFLEHMRKSLAEWFDGAAVKVVLVALALSLVLPGALRAEEAQLRKSCESVAKAAHAIMYARQVGVSLTDLLKIAKDKAGENPEAHLIAENLMIAAFERPRYYTEPAQKMAMEDFRDAIHLECLKTRRWTK